MIEQVEPIEKTDPEFAENLKWYCNDKISKTKRVNDKVPVIAESAKVKRNGPCTCGSGKKFKKCCGRK